MKSKFFPLIIFFSFFLFLQSRRIYKVTSGRESSNSSSDSCCVFNSTSSTSCSLRTIWNCCISKYLHSGCDILLPSGNYYINSPQLQYISKSNFANNSGDIRLIGDGIDKTNIYSFDNRLHNRFLFIKVEGAAKFGLSISGINFQNFGGKPSSVYGQVIYVSGNVNISMNDVTFNNILSGHGALYIANVHQGSLNRISFYNSTAFDSGGAIYIFQSKNIVIENSLFTGLLAIRLAGSIFVESSSDVIFQSNVFEANTAIFAGGSMALRNSSHILIKKCLFDSGLAGTGAIGYDFGGAIYLDFNNNHVSIVGCEISGTQSSYAMIYANTSNLYMTISDCNIHDNYGGSLGLFSGNDYAVVSNTQFIYNFGNNIGCLSVDNNNYGFQIIGCYFDSNAGLSGDPSAYGAAMSFRAHNEYLVVRNCIFSGNYVDMGNTLSYGGAISMYSSNTHAVVSGCTFAGNNAYTAGAIYVGEFNHYLNITHCSFSNNYAKVSGAIHINGENNNATISSCVFKNNNAYDHDGGAINIVQSSKNILIVSCTFSNNNALQNGGAIYINQQTANVIIASCSFKSNRAYFGGAVNVQNGNFGVVITRCTFNSNQANAYIPTALGAQGGAIYSNYVNYHMVISYCTFVSNFVPPAVSFSTGGVIHFASTISFALITDCTFVANRGAIGGAIYMETLSEFLHITRCTFLLNSATRGGAIFFADAHDFLIISKCLFMGNTATQAGAIYFSMNSQANQLLNTTFINNVATLGGALYIGETLKNLTFKSCYFKSNRALYGGAWYVSQTNVDIYVRSSEFFNNSALSGGAIFFNIFNQNIYISDSNFTSNTASGNGGAIAFLSSTTGVFVAHCSFTSNVAGTIGGAIELDESNAVNYIYDTLFQSNIATSGAAIALQTKNTVGILGSMTWGIVSCTFVDNHVTLSGGAIVSRSNNLINLFGNVFTSNNAVGTASDSGGGAISLWLSNAVYLSNSNFRNNSVDFGSGGALSLEDNNVNVVVDKCSFIGNLAKRVNGGAVVVNDGSNDGIVFRNSQFLSNNAKIGGALFIVEVLRASLVNCTFRDNVASNSGAAVAISGGRLLVMATNLYSRNSATVNGGAVFLSGVYQPLVTKSTFRSNVAQAGSAIYVESSWNSSLKGNVFTSNVATSGGTVAWDAITMTEPRDLRDSSTWVENTASYGPKWATQVYNLMSYPNNISAYRASATLPQINVTFRDYYGQRVASAFGQQVTATITASECKILGFVKNTISASVVEGVAVFSDLAVYCGTGERALVKFIVTSGGTGSGMLANVSVGFRGCHRGEIYAGGLCQPCANGSYSLKENSDNSILQCQTCPPEAKSCYGATLILDKGYWRSGRYAEHIFSCPAGENSCLGGSGAADELCADGYGGPLCAVCKSNYFQATFDKTCTKCSTNKYSVVAILLIILLILFSIVMLVKLLNLGGEMLHLDFKDFVGLVAGGQATSGRAAYNQRGDDVLNPVDEMQSYEPNIDRNVRDQVDDEDISEQKVEEGVGKVHVFQTTKGMDGADAPPATVADTEKRQLNRDMGARVAAGFQMAVALKLVINSLARIFSQVSTSLHFTSLHFTRSQAAVVMCTLIISLRTVSICFYITSVL